LLVLVIFIEVCFSMNLVLILIVWFSRFCEWFSSSFCFRF